MKIKILTHTSGEYETTVENFDPMEINQKLNDSSINTILIGNINISRIDIKLILPIEELS